jgi:energy-coupling factor transporter ATP-binding protein EcfA2
MELPLSIDTFVNELSSGQTQRVNLATTIAIQSDLMLLDEPGSYLDSSSLVWMKNLIETVSDGTTIAIASNSGEDFLTGANLLDISQFR